MDARTTMDQPGLQLGPDGRFVGLEERFDDHLGWAYRFGMVDNWEVFRCELHAALTLALRLGGEGSTRTISSRWPGSASSTATSRWLLSRPELSLIRSRIGVAATTRSGSW